MFVSGIILANHQLLHHPTVSLCTSLKVFWKTLELIKNNYVFCIPQTATENGNDCAVCIFAGFLWYVCSEFQIMVVWCLFVCLFLLLLLLLLFILCLSILCLTQKKPFSDENKRDNNNMKLIATTKNDLRLD